jgi:hypothetical protein
MNIQYQVVLLVIGSIIGSISSICTTIIAENIRNLGKLRLYYKVVFSKIIDRETWGFYYRSDGLTFEVPIWIELHNTSNSVRIVRDLNILLYNNGKIISQMIQINKTNKEWYGNEGAYSFAAQPKSVKKYDCHFIYKHNELSDSNQFDEIRLRYFDDKNKQHIFPLKTIKECWHPGSLGRDGSWHLAK